MEFIENFKLGALEGATAFGVTVALVLAAVFILIVIIVNAVKSAKEHRDSLEDGYEDNFYQEYGISGEELYLNERLAQKREMLRRSGEAFDEEDFAGVPEIKRIEQVEQKPVEEQPEEPVVQPVEEQPVVEEPKAEEPKVEEPIEQKVEEPQKEEPVQEKVEEKVEEPAPAPVEPQKEEEKVPEPVPEPVVEQPKVEEPKVEEPAVAKEELKPDKLEDAEPQKQGVARPKTKKIVKKKPDDWSKYDGEYEGYYYDPEDACYYEGTPSPELAKKLAAKQAELEAANANKDKKVVIKKIAPPFAALKTPKNERKTPKKVAGFDEAVIYGKYVVEHVDKQDGTQEYFYTLYNPSGKSIYESSNYSTLEYCQRAINRFKAHAIVGQFTIEAEGGKFFFVLKRKSYVHKGSPQATFEAANEEMRQIKNYYATDIVREQ